MRTVVAQCPQTGPQCSLITPRASSRIAVMASDTTSEPRQPRRFEKKMNKGA
jgi:hypothetical protein